MQRNRLLCVALCASLAPAPAARAVDYFWQNATGGAFTEVSNWLPFVPPGVQGPGGALDTVNFDLGATEGAPYSITDVAGQNNRLLVRNDSVQLSVFPSYSLESTGGADPSLVVGRASGDVANLILSGASTSTFTNDVTRIANVAGSTGSVIAVELQWTNGNLRVGHAGAGELTIDEFANVTSASASLGHLANSSGTALVHGDATWTTTGEFIVGREGDGLLSILNSGVVVNANASIGDEATGEGTVHVAGPSPAWTVQNVLDVGTSGDGTVNLTGGSIVTNHVNVGGLPASDGTVSMVAGSWTTSGLLTVGGQSIGPTVGGSGLFRTLGGSVMIHELAVTPNGLVVFDGGVIDVGSISVEEPSGQFQFTGGLLFLDEFQGDFEHAGGTLAPNPTTAVSGNYTQLAAATLSFHIDGEAANNEFDTATVSGTASLAGDLNFILNGLYDPQPGEVYTLLTAGDLVGNFNNVANGQRLESSNGFGSFVVHYGPGSLFNPDQVVLTSYLPRGPSGDYNDNGIVDAADFTVWRDNLGAPAGTLLNDVDGGIIDLDQYDTWRENFGTSGSGTLASFAVPEPSSSTLLLVASLLLRRIRSTFRARYDGGFEETRLG